LTLIFNKFIILAIKGGVNMKKLKRIYSLLLLVTILIPLNVKANITCKDGTTSPSCMDCHRGCCSHHGGCASTSSSSSSSKSNKSSSSSSSSKSNKSSNSSSNSTSSSNSIKSSDSTTKSSDSSTSTKKDDKVTNNDGKTTTTPKTNDSSSLSDDNSPILALIGITSLGAGAYALAKRKKHPF